MQTVIIRYPNTHLDIHGIEYRPRLPDYLLKVLALQRIVMNKNSEITEWRPDGVVIKTRADGTEKIWWPKPTLSEIMQLCKTSKGGYFRFFGNGRVEYRVHGEVLAWLEGETPYVEYGNIEFPDGDGEPPEFYCINPHCDRNCQYHD